MSAPLDGKASDSEEKAREHYNEARKSIITAFTHLTYAETHLHLAGKPLTKEAKKLLSKVLAVKEDLDKIVKKP